MDMRITVPPEGTCAGKATLVDVSGDPIGYHLREALRLLEEQVGPTGVVKSQALVATRLDVISAIEEWGRKRRGE